MNWWRDNSEKEPNNPFGAVSAQRFPSGLLQMQRPQKSLKSAYFNHRDLLSRGVGKPKKSKKKIVCLEILSSIMSSTFSHVQNLVNGLLSVSAKQLGLEQCANMHSVGCFTFLGFQPIVTTSQDLLLDFKLVTFVKFKWLSPDLGQ